MKTQRKIWLGVGACLVTATGATATRALTAATAPGLLSGPAIAIPRAHAGRIVIAQRAGRPQEAGEANEAKDLASLPPELAFGVRIALIRGHLHVGDELIRQQQWNAALPHFLHPGEEIYGDIKGELADYQVAPFDQALKALADVVKAKQGGSDYAKALKAVNDALAAADAGMKAKQADWPGFVIEMAVEALKAASNEYREAIVDGRLAKPVEYQDARGFISEAERMIEGVAGDLQKKDAAALAETRAGLAELKKAFPSPLPPRSPIKDYAAVLGDVARIEVAAGKLM